MTKLFKLIAAVILVANLSSCSVSSHIIQQPNTYVEMKKDDFTFSQQVTGEATETRILGIDWNRLFIHKYGATERGGLIGAIGFVPLYGYNLVPTRVEAYALHDMFSKTPGYDVVFYPSFEKQKFVFPILFSRTKVTVKARLAKVN